MNIVDLIDPDKLITILYYHKGNDVYIYFGFSVVTVHHAQQFNKIPETCMNSN